jgi:hypothetical protein
MAPRPYRTADLARAVRAAIIGMPVKTLEIDRFGKITVQMAEPTIPLGCDTGDALGDDKGETVKWEERMKKLGLEP